MHRLRHILLIYIAFLALSCEKGQLPPSLEEGTDAVRFAISSSDVKTRGTTLADFALNDAIAITGFFLDNTLALAPTAKPNFMYEQRVSKQADGTWTYGPTKYWSNDPADHYIFFGRHPVEHSNITDISGNSTAGFPSFVYTMPEAIANQIDLMVANTSLVTKRASTPIPFDHALSKITFAVKGDDVNRFIKSVTLHTIKPKATLEFTSDDFRWLFDAATAATDITANIENGALRNDVTTASTTQSISTDAGCLFVLPQLINKLLITVVTNDGTADQTQTLTLSKEQGWAPGKAYEYTFNLYGEGKELWIDGAITDWILLPSDLPSFE